MSTAEITQQEMRSSIQIEETAKQIPMVRVKVYEGTTEEEVERIKNLAVVAYQKTKAMLGASAQF